MISTSYQYINDENIIFHLLVQTKIGLDTFLWKLILKNYQECIISTSMILICTLLTVNSEIYLIFFTTFSHNFFVRCLLNETDGFLRLSTENRKNIYIYIKTWKCENAVLWKYITKEHMNLRKKKKKENKACSWMH